MARSARVRLDPMTEAEFRAYRERGIARRAGIRVAQGVWNEAEALATGRAEYDRELPDGRATPHQHFVVARDPESGGRVGEAWYSIETQGGKTQFWVEWLTVDPEHRRRGYGSALVRALAEEARQAGADRLGLFVRAANVEAVALYDRLGFTTVGRIVSLAVPP